MEKRTKKLVTCTLCWKEYMWHWWSKYCSDECANKVHQEQNKILARKRREKEKICKTCWITFVTSSNAKNCPDCFHKIYYCPCGNLKSTEGASLCSECLKNRECPQCWSKMWTTSWKAILCKSCQKEKRKEMAKARVKRESSKNKNSTTICKGCWIEFQRTQWNLVFCPECKIKRKTCPNCWGPKSSDHKHCNSCKKLSHTYSCKQCWKQCVWVKRTLYCEDCYPKCKICGKQVAHVHNWCCSISCATKYKRTVTSKELFVNHLQDMLDGKYNNWGKSKANEKWSDFFSKNNIEYEDEFRMENTMNFPMGRNYVFWDFKIGNILIDINPTMTHNCTIPYRKWSPILAKGYHMYKTLLAEKEGYYPIHIFDWDNTAKTKLWLLSLLTKKQRIYAKEIRQVSWTDAAVFCEQNHLQWASKATVRYWLYKNDTLYVLSWWLYNKEEDTWTLTRLCSLSWTKVAHWAEKLMKHFINVHSPKKIISFSDATKHSGKVYDALWFKQDPVINTSYWRSDKKWKVYYWRRACQKQYIHQLKGFNWPGPYLENQDHPFWQQSETQIMTGMWYVKVEDAGMRKHIRSP